MRKDDPAEIWQYSGADCVVDFYLYAGDAGGLAVAYMEARNQAAEATPADRCVKSLMQSVSAEPQQKTLVSQPRLDRSLEVWSEPERSQAAIPRPLRPRDIGPAVLGWHLAPT